MIHFSVLFIFLFSLLRVAKKMQPIKMAGANKKVFKNFILRFSIRRLFLNTNTPVTVDMCFGKKIFIKICWK